MTENRYTRLFNQGYFLSEYDPGLLRKLIKATEESSAEANEPLSAGKSQFIQEMLQNKLKEIDQPEKNKLDRGLEPER